MLTLGHVYVWIGYRPLFDSALTLPIQFDVSSTCCVTNERTEPGFPVAIGRKNRWALPGRCERRSPRSGVCLLCAAVKEVIEMS
jgi:hypothetical protein